MNLREVECFLKVAEHLHFGKAAEELFLGQPAVSESIRRLEREVGGALFDRTTRRVRLTALGVAFRDDARLAYDMLRRAYERSRTMAEQHALEFALGYSGDLGGELLDIVAELKRQVDGVVVSLRAMTTPHQTRRIRDGRLHAAIGWEPEPDPDFYRVELGPAEFVAVVPPYHRFAKRESLSVKELASEPLIGWPRAVNPTAYDRFARAMDDTGHAWTLVGAASGPENVAARVLSDFGVGVCFASAAQARPLDGVAYIPLPDLRPDVERVLYWRRGETHPALKPFVRIATRRLSHHGETHTGPETAKRQPEKV
jgi:DNA-binding transcriptional LysR family regulator